MATKLMQCNCLSEYQDKKFGKGMRVHNQCKDPKQVRCTVCDQVKML